VGGCESKHTVIAISTLLKGLIRQIIIVYRFCSNDPKITNKTYYIQLTYRRGYRKGIRKKVIRGVWVSFPRNGNPFSNPFILMFLRCLKVHTHFYNLFAEIGYGFRVPRNQISCAGPGFLGTQNLQRSGFPDCFVPSNSHSTWISQPRFCVPMNPEPTVEFPFQSF